MDDVCTKSRKSDVSQRFLCRRDGSLSSSLRVCNHGGGNTQDCSLQRDRSPYRSLDDPTVSSASSYSPRRATMGSVLDALMAGSAEAASASSSIVVAESASTPGSNGLTSNKKERSKRDAAAAPSTPNAQPIAASLALELRMNRITPVRWQPSATRTA